MKNIILIIISLYLNITSFFAQEQEMLIGKVIDKKTGKTIYGASISIMHNENIVTGAASNIDGIYNISVASGIYTVKVSFLDYFPEKAVIEIKEGVTTNLDFQLCEARFNIITIHDTIRIYAIELKTIDNKFKLAIDNHIKESQKKLFFPNKKKNIIVVHLWDRNYYCQEEVDINEKNLKYKKFKENSFGDGYDISIMFIGKKNDAVRDVLSRNRNHFHYKYKNWDVFFGTYIENFEFPFAEDIKKYEFYFQYKDIEDDKNGQYDMSNKNIEKFWYGGTTYNKYEMFTTFYFISNFEVIFKIDKSKCLICKPIIM